MKRYRNISHGNLYSWVIVIAFSVLQGCATTTTTTISCQFESNPSGARIHGGATPARMDYIGTSPHTTTFTGVGPYWQGWYYQFRKEGYKDSKIIVAKQLPVNTNRKVWAVLEKEDRNNESALPNVISVFTGTGWITNNGFIVTNYHVVEGQIEIKVRFNSLNKDTCGAKVILSDKYNDLAVLQLDDVRKNTLQGIPISSISPKIGERVFTIGFPLSNVMGKRPKITDGIISSLSGIQDDPRIIQTTVPIQSGNSGGPLLNMKGEVVGVTTSRLVSENGKDIPQNVNYAVKSAYVLALLSSAENKDYVSMPSLPSSKLEDIVPKIQKSIVQIIVHKSN